MRRFDYTFLGHGMVPASIANLAGAIREMKAMESGRMDLFPDMLSNLEQIARVESVKGSNAIEGIVTTDQRIREIVNGNTAPLNHDEMEIVGYRDALGLIRSNYPTMEIDSPTILGLHRTMLSYTCLLYTSDAADDLLCVDLGGRRIIKKKKKKQKQI